MKEDIKKAIIESVKSDPYAPKEFEPTEKMIEYFYQQCIQFIIHGNGGVMKYIRQQLAEDFGVCSSNEQKEENHVE